MSLRDEQFLKELLVTFQMEGEEHIAALSSGLIELENAPAQERRSAAVENVFREAHSLKGAARAVSLPKVESVCQTMESIFAEIKTQSRPLSRQLFDQLHQMVAVASAEITAAVSGRRGVATTVPPPVSDKKPVSAAAAPAEAASLSLSQDERTVLGDTVRISSSKLTLILQEAEELLSSKATARHRAVELRSIRVEIEAWSNEWRKVQRHLRTLEAGEPLLAFFEQSRKTMGSLQDQVTLLGGALENDTRILDRRVNDLIEDVKRASMVPFSALLAGFPKLVRDLGSDCGKDVELSISGGDIEASRRILDGLKTPLIHLVRNSIDHGIETPAERQQRGKPSRASVAITVSPKPGGRVELAVSDDGKGIDGKKVIAAAVKQGIISADESNADPQQVLSLIFQSGFSTTQQITPLSGRGLGLAIVRENVEALGGQVSVESTAGSGTTFRLAFPITLATFRGVLVRTGEHLFIIPTMFVQRALRVSQDQIRSVENRPITEVAGRAVSIAWLDETLGLGTRPAETEPGRNLPGLLVESSGERILFLVDEVLHDQEVLVKSLGKQLVRVRNVAGGAVLDTGRVAPVLNVADLIRSAASLTRASLLRAAEQQPKSILVVEDSITARTLVKGIFESAGYSVSTAVNGADAFRILKNESFDLVVSDVEMPEMNGFELTTKIRSDERLADTPVVLVTALDSREDRERGAEVGANAYIVKGSFDQSNLLEVAQRLI